MTGGESLRGGNELKGLSPVKYDEEGERRCEVGREIGKAPLLGGELRGGRPEREGEGRCA